MMKNGKPDSITVLGIRYDIIYCNNPAEVDAFKRESLMDQCDFWTRTIRIYDNGRQIEDIWATIWHEVLHAIGELLKLDILNKGGVNDDKKHDELDILALALSDTLFRNDLINVENGYDGIKALERA